MLVKTRFAPSPTGYIHMGNVRTALFSDLLARSKQGHFLLRIEDTDRERSKSTYIDQLKTDLQWLGIQWQEGADIPGDQGPYYQSQRSNIYAHYYQQLIEQERAYPCFCSEQELAISRKMQLSAGKAPRYSGKCRSLSAEERQQKLQQGLKPTLRFRMSKDQQIVFTDLVKGEQCFDSNDIGDFIIRRANGGASFMFCNAIDDALMAVTHVLRGEDHLTNTPRQLAILSALPLPLPSYGHLSLIIGKDRAPLSKRNGSRNIMDLRAEGYLPLAIVNYLARLGHYYQDNDFMILQSLADKFSIENLSSSAAAYDEKQLLHWQKQAVMALTPSALQDWLSSSLSSVPADKQDLFLKVAQENCLFPLEAATLAQSLFAPSIEKHEMIEQAGMVFFDQAITLVEQHGEDFSAVKKALATALNIKGKALFMPLRLALTGQAHGIDLASIFQLQGKALLLSRLTQAKNLI